jgi:hypothetical protein
MQAEATLVSGPVTVIDEGRDRRRDLPSIRKLNGAKAASVEDGVDRLLFTTSIQPYPDDRDVRLSKMLERTPLKA